MPADLFPGDVSGWDGIVLLSQIQGRGLEDAGLDQPAGHLHELALGLVLGEVDKYAVLARRRIGKLGGLDIDLASLGGHWIELGSVQDTCKKFSQAL